MHSHISGNDVDLSNNDLYNYEAKRMNDFILGLENISKKLPCNFYNSSQWKDKVSTLKARIIMFKTTYESFIKGIDRIEDRNFLRLERAFNHVLESAYEVIRYDMPVYQRDVQVEIEKYFMVLNADFIELKFKDNKNKKTELEFKFSNEKFERDLEEERKAHKNTAAALHVLEGKNIELRNEKEDLALSERKILRTAGVISGLMTGLLENIDNDRMVVNSSGSSASSDQVSVSSIYFRVKKLVEAKKREIDAEIDKIIIPKPNFFKSAISKSPEDQEKPHASSSSIGLRPASY